MPPLRARLHSSCSGHVIRHHSFALSIPERAGISANRSHSARSVLQLAIWEFGVLETTLSRKADAKRDELLGLVRAGNKVATERSIRLNAPWMLAVARRYLKDEVWPRIACRRASLARCATWISSSNDAR